MSVSSKLNAPPSLNDVDEAAGVSASTVSRIVNGDFGRASRLTIDKVQAAVASLGYRPNPVGRSLRRRESQIVAMLSPNLDNPAMAAIAASVEKALRDAGYVMILCDTHDRPELQDEYLEAMRGQLARGYILVSAVPSPGLQAAMARGEVIVCVNRRNPLGSSAFVGIDNRKAGSDVADYFHRLGISDLAALRPEIMSSSIGERIEGFLARCEHLGQSRDTIPVASGQGPDHLAIGYSAIRNLVAQHRWPAGLLCPSDLMAYAAYRHAGETGRRVPEETRITGIDNNVFNKWIAPWLSSVEIPYRDFGAAVVEQLLACWRGEPAVDRILPHFLAEA
jgi:LacI family transcriptional regulator